MKQQLGRVLMVSGVTGWLLALTTILASDFLSYLELAGLLIIPPALFFTGFHIFLKTKN